MNDPRDAREQHSGEQAAMAVLERVKTLRLSRLESNF